MTVTFRPAKRENVALLIGLAGGTGSGKTMSALLLARGLANGQPFIGIDTENGRMNHYADKFPELLVGDIHAPFRPSKYADAIQAGEKHLAGLGVPANHRVIVVDSGSHEWYGDGGCLDWHDEIMGGNQAKNLSAWIEPKRAHKAMVTRLLQVNAHVIICFRAEQKVEMVGGKIVEKKSLTGLDGWIPVAEKNLPYELTASFLLTADKPGVPKPIKLNEDHRPFFPLDRPITEQSGRALAEWAAGGQTVAVITDQQRKQIGQAAKQAGITTDELRAIVQTVANVTESARIPADKYDALMTAIAHANTPADPEADAIAFGEEN